MCHYTTLLCTKFQGNQITRFHFMVTFIPRWKEEKNEETKLIFESSYLRNALHDLVEIWNVGYWRWRASPQQKSSSFVQAARSYVYAKIAFLFFLLINSRVWRVGFLCCTTLPCVLIKPITLVIIEIIMHVWRHQSGTQLVSHSVKNSINCFENLWWLVEILVILTNQCCHIITKESYANFGWYFLIGHAQSLCIWYQHISKY